MGGLNESILQMFKPKHIYKSIHETARISSVIVLHLSFLGFLWVFLCKCKCFMNYNKISLRAVCRLKCVCSVGSEELAGGNSDKKGTCPVLLPTSRAEIS